MLRIRPDTNEALYASARHYFYVVNASHIYQSSAFMRPVAVKANAV